MFERADARPAESPAAAVPELPVKKKSGDDAFSIAYRSFCYRLMGERFDRGPTNIIATERLKQAGLNISYGMHLGVVVVTTVISVAVAFVFGIILFAGILHSALWYGYVAAIVGITAAAVQLGFRSLIGTRIANRKDALD